MIKSNETDNEMTEDDLKDNDISTYNFGNVKRSKKNRLSIKAVKFSKHYGKGETMGNGTKSAIKAGYSESSASVTASRLLKDSRVLMILNESVDAAQGVIRDLMYSGESDAVRLAASKEVLDRTQGKSIARSITAHTNVTVEDMLNTSD